MRVQYNSKRGYYLSLDQKEETKLDSSFIQRCKQGKRLALSTEELVNFNSRIKEVVAEIYLITESVVQDLVSFIKDRILSLHRTSESIALLDLLLSFASLASSSRDYSRPEFTRHGPIAIKKGRHPILDKINQNSFIPVRPDIGENRSKKKNNKL